MARWLTMKNLFSLFLVAWFAYGVWEARSYGFLARIFPFYVSLVLLVFALASIVIDATRIIKKSQAGEGAATGSDLGVDWDRPMAEVYVAFMAYVGIIVGVYIGIWVVGYPLALTLFIGLFYRFAAGAGWIGSAIAAAGGLAFMATASRALGMYWPEGLLTLPWPLG